MFGVHFKCMPYPSIQVQEKFMNQEIELNLENTKSEVIETSAAVEDYKYAIEQGMLRYLD